MTTALCATVFACGGTKGETSGTDTEAGSSGGTTATTVSSATSGPTSGGTTSAGTTAEPTGGSGSAGVTEGGTTAASTTDATASSGGTAGGTTMGGVPMPVSCGGKIYECGDAIDNDGDGAIDGGDKECTSPCDDSEGSLQTNLPGQNLDCKNDCYWDSDSGVGNDKCQYDLQCDPLNPGGMIGCEFKMECPPVVPQQCLDVCTKLVPNGCDCFGCCHVDTGNGTVDIFLGSNPDCSLQNLDACGKCTFQDSCNNVCEPEKCEVCFGQDAPPDNCDMPGCDANAMPCMVDKNGVSNCPEGFFCSTGCCQPIIPG